MTEKLCTAVDEDVALAQTFAFNLVYAPDRNVRVDWELLGEARKLNLLALIRFECVRLLEDRERRKRIPAQRRATRLLDQFLTDAQRRRRRRSGCFEVTGTLGNTYRLWPHTAYVERVERHGTRWYARTSFCLHDPGRELPPADVSLGHLLWLRTDEALFLELAHATPRAALWDGQWLRRLHAARRERVARQSARELQARMHPETPPCPSTTTSAPTATASSSA